MGAAPRMAQQNSQQRRVPLGVSTASQQELNAPANQTAQRQIPKANRTPAASPVKRSAHPRLAKMAAPPPAKRRRATELIKLSIGSGCFSRPTLEFSRRKHRSMTTAALQPEARSCAAPVPVINGKHSTPTGKSKLDDRRTAVEAVAQDVDGAASESVHFTGVVVIKQESVTADEETSERLKQEELLAEKDEEIGRLRREISRLRKQVAKLEEQVADNDRMRPPSDTCSRSRLEQPRLTVSSPSTRASQVDSAEKKNRKSVRLQDSTEHPDGRKASWNEPAIENPLHPIRVMPYALYKRVIDTEEDLECRQGVGSIEVPRWREKPVEEGIDVCKTGGHVSHEATGDEVYLKRHLKLETDEKRRKRWDRQWMSEQKSFERASRRQARRHSSHASAPQVATSSNFGPAQGTWPRSSPRARAGRTVNSLFPSGSRLQMIELAEKVPVVAWGCSIPQFQYREFSFE